MSYTHPLKSDSRAIGNIARWALSIVTGFGMALTPLAASTPNPDCTLIMPANPLSAQGLATPYQLVATNPANGPCHETNTNQSAFVQAAIIDLISGQISIYNPLVIDKGTVPAAAPVVPHLPFLSVVATWFGYNGNNLTLVGATPATLSGNDCHQSMGQFAYCNAPAFFLAANSEILIGSLTVPPLGIGKDNRPCPSVRSFAVVDQDQSDNLPTTYLIAPGGKLAQFTQANKLHFPGYTPLINGSDNRLTDVALDGALLCHPWTAADLADPGSFVPALPLNELQAAQYQLPPVALVPLGDEFTFSPAITGVPNLARVNEYRAGVNQFPAIFASDASTTTYCSNLLTEGTSKLVLDQLIFNPLPSPFPDLATTLFNFMARRLKESYDNLGCQPLLGIPNPVTLTENAAGVVTSAVVH